ncbi:MAG TPA: ATP-binding cassette domain-containing protein [Atribacteraceae bacterium]|nr:ATP-binding cassette domain-containing protein [Atribacteraceae bacterium]
MINLQNIALRLDSELIFDNLSWFVGDGGRVGLVGANGTGKTTLLRILNGEIEPDAGTVDIPRTRSVGYLPQELTALGDLRVIDYLKKTSGLSALERELQDIEETLAGLSPESPDFGTFLKRHDRTLKEYTLLDGFSFQARAHSVLHGLGFSAGETRKATNQFSGGWQMKILLASLLLQKPDLLLLDEPTNHLDTDNLEWLENYLSGYRGTIIIVSHDRRFLDTITTETALLHQRNLTVFPGGYSRSMESLHEQEQKREKERQLQARFLEKERSYIDRFRYKASKASQMQSRIRRMRKMELVEAEITPKRVRLRFPNCERSAHEVLSVRQVTKSYGNQEVFRNINFAVFRGEKIALVGMNGAGKSTLTRLISGLEKPNGGTITVGQLVKVGYFFQESVKNLDFTKTVWDEINQFNPQISQAEKRNLLGAFLFSGDTVNKPIAVLSGGEKARLSLLKILLQDTNFLVLDEPTNHLDIPTCELFQQALEEYTGTLLIISHDRYLLDRVVSRVIEIRQGELTEYPGNYSYYLRKRQEREDRAKEVGGVSWEKKAVPSSMEKVQKRETAERRNRLYREKRAIQEKLEPIERILSSLEQQKEENEKLLGNPDVLKDSHRVARLMVELKDIGRRQEALYGEWEQLLILLDNIGGENQA